MENLSNPVVTIITPSFNQGKFIERTIRSILSQDYPNIEHIVMDGGSTDETLDILKKYEGRLRWISEKDTGQSNAINKGFRLAKGEIVAWLNSDDIYLPGAVSKAVRYFDAHPEMMTVYGEGYIIDEHDVTMSRFPFTEPRFDLTKLIYFGDYILQQTSFFRRTVFDSIDMLRESYHYTMDWDLFIRIGKRFPIGYIPDDIACIREHGTAKTIVGGKERFREIVRMIRDHGVMRYPPAYFNYMWDAYGKDLFGNDGGGAGVSIKGRLLSLAKRVAQSLFARSGLHDYHPWYADGWMGSKGLVVLPKCKSLGGSNALLVVGEATGPNLPLRIRIRVNRKFEKRIDVREAGEFRQKIGLPDRLLPDDAFHIEFKSDRSFVPAEQGGGNDTRDLAFILKKLEVV